jgi:hypothetical protein
VRRKADGRAIVGGVYGGTAQVEVIAATPHTGGLPTQPSLEHSKLATHDIPSGSGGDVHSNSPPPLSAHVPWQQSAVVRHTEPVARQGPAPGSQRSAGSSQAPQQGAEPPEWQSSPEARHVATGSRTHRLPPPPPSLLHSFEQHWAFAVQGVPSRAHSAPPQIPPLQPSEQQSAAVEQAVPAGLQAARHARVIVPATGSHSPLQHPPGVVHDAPAPPHVPG